VNRDHHNFFQKSFTELFLMNIIIKTVPVIAMPAFLAGCSGSGQKTGTGNEAAKAKPEMPSGEIERIKE
jgi:hypothetical protein